MKLDDAKSVVNSFPKWKRNYQITKYIDDQEKSNKDPDLDPAYVNLYFNHNEAN